MTYLPGDLAIWIFILAELLVFALFFAAYAFTRMNHVHLFNQYQATLNRDVALVNTLALLTSSYFVIRGVVAAREGDNPLCARWLWAAVGIGGVFLLVKTAEYAHHLGGGPLRAGWPGPGLAGLAARAVQGPTDRRLLHGAARCARTLALGGGDLAARPGESDRARVRPESWELG